MLVIHLDGWIAVFANPNPEATKPDTFENSFGIRWHNSRPGRKVPPGHDSGARRSFNPVHNDRNRA